MSKWTNERPAVNWQRRIAEESAPIDCLNWEAEFVVDAINAEFRHALGVCAGQPPAPMALFLEPTASTGCLLTPPEGGQAAHPPPSDDWQPACRLTTALCLAVIAACSVAGMGIIYWLIRSIGGC